MSYAKSNKMRAAHRHPLRSDDGWRIVFFQQDRGRVRWWVVLKQTSLLTWHAKRNITETATVKTLPNVSITHTSPSHNVADTMKDWDAPSIIPGRNAVWEILSRNSPCPNSKSPKFVVGCPSGRGVDVEPRISAVWGRFQQTCSSGGKYGLIKVIIVVYLTIHPYAYLAYEKTGPIFDWRVKLTIPAFKERGWWCPGIARFESRATAAWLDRNRRKHVICYVRLHRLSANNIDAIVADLGEATFET